MKSSERLRISPKTVGTHVQRVLVKLDLHSRVEAVAYAYREGPVEGVAAHALAGSRVWRRGPAEPRLRLLRLWRNLERVRFAFVRLPYLFVSFVREVFLWQPEP
jgi:Bacterial regulatory proteins, luxR family